MTYQAEKQKKDVDILFRYLDELPSFYREYIMGITVGIMANSTKVAYAKVIRYFFEWLLEVNPAFSGKTIRDITISDLEQLTPLDANEYMVYLSSTKKPKTINQYVAAVSSMYDELIRYNKIEKNPFHTVRRIKEKEHAIISLTSHEKEKLMNCIKYGTGLTQRELNFHHPVRDVALFSLFLNTGMRVSEIVGLDLRDIDFDEHSALITRKGGKVVYVWFSDETQTKMEEYLDYRRTVLLKPFDMQEALFVNQRGNRLSVRSTEMLLKKYVNAAGLTKKITPHKLRSTYAMDLYEISGDLSLVQESLSHASIATTQIYARASRERVRNARNMVK